ncbi:MaoC family dehydratase [Paradesulfitobacterium aromaticivorans]
MYKEKRFSEIQVGDKESIRRTITEADIVNFAGVSGDFNPLHTDEEYAKNTMFKGKIAHGFFTAALITNVVGNKLPGPGSVYLKQELRFLAPVRPGDTIVATAEVVEKIEGKQRVRLRTTCTTQSGELVLDGEATLLVLNK